MFKIVSVSPVYKIVRVPVQNKNEADKKDAKKQIEQEIPETHIEGILDVWA